MKMVYPEMDFGKLFVQLPSVTFLDLFKKSKPELLKGRIFLNSEYMDNVEYSALIFKMLKLAYKRNAIFYAKMLFADLSIVKRIIFSVVRNAFNAHK